MRADDRHPVTLASLFHRSKITNVLFEQTWPNVVEDGEWETEVEICVSDSKYD